ncbi:MAG: hypothetical protein ACSHWS_15985 [Sulfitobacter sp.]
MKDLISTEWFSALCAEGLVSRAVATEQRKDVSDAGGWRSGNPSRFLATAIGGEIQSELYADASLAERLGALSGTKLKPTGTEGSYSYYDRPGHYLGLHRDIRTCDLTLITCLEKTESVAASGALRLYPKSAGASLESITKETPRVDFNLQATDSIVLLGGVVPHEVLPAARGFSRSVSVLCFEMI